MQQLHALLPLWPGWHCRRRSRHELEQVLQHVIGANRGQAVHIQELFNILQAQLLVSA